MAFARKILLGILLLFIPMAAQAADSSLEYRVKAGFLFHFAMFVEWPATILPPGAPLRIGLLAPPEVCSDIEQSLAGKSAAGHPLVTERVTTEALAKDAPHILFVQRSADISPSALAQILGDRPVLVVGETSGFASSGGAIGFVIRGDTLRFQVNLAAASHANLQLSGQLASLAEIVKAR